MKLVVKLVGSNWKLIIMIHHTLLYFVYKIYSLSLASCIILSSSNSWPSDTTSTSGIATIFVSPSQILFRHKKMKKYTLTFLIIRYRNNCLYYYYRNEKCEEPGSQWKDLHGTGPCSFFGCWGFTMLLTSISIDHMSCYFRIILQGLFVSYGVCRSFEGVTGWYTTTHWIIGRITL